MRCLHLPGDVRKGDLGTCRNKERKYCTRSDETAGNTIVGHRFCRHTAYVTKLATCEKQSIAWEL
jgi:hypothetical protein